MGPNPHGLLAGIDTATLGTVTSLTAAGVFQLDVTGADEVQADLTSVTGGNVSVAGQLVAS